MGLWKVDLKSRYGAEAAARSGSFGNFIAAGLTCLAGGYFFFHWNANPRFAVALVILFFEFLIFLVAGFRLRAGKGRVWSIVALIALVFQTLSQLGAFGILPLLVKLAVAFQMAEGIAGAAALRKDHFPDDAEEVFG